MCGDCSCTATKSNEIRPNTKAEYFDFRTHDSESRGLEEAGRTRQTSVLFTGSTALKFVNTLNKPS